MRFFLVLFLLALFATGCDNPRVYEEYTDFEERYWMVKDVPSFEFTIQDTTARYNLLGNIRNSVSYPWSRIFINYRLQDSTGVELHKALLSDFLFDAKTGKPKGVSGLGDIFDHQLPLLKDYRFKRPGKYKVSFEQFMRTDTLQGILAVGLRVEKAPVED
jgi:gliding motility-associated lipoprotein GldH